jgi:hypothetical protein
VLAKVTATLAVTAIAQKRERLAIDLFITPHSSPSRSLDFDTDL